MCDGDVCTIVPKGPSDGPPVRLALLNIPDSGAFYEPGESGIVDDVTESVVRKFLSDFLAGGVLERKQLSK